MAKDSVKELVLITKRAHDSDKLYLQYVNADSIAWTNNINEARDFTDAQTAGAAIRDLNKILMNQLRPARGTEIFKDDVRQVVISAERYTIKVSPILTATFMKK